MDLSVAAGHLATGVRTVEMDEARGLVAHLQRAARRVGFRLEQALLTYGLAQGAALWPHDRPAAMAFLERGRASFMRPRPACSRIFDANAIRTPAPPAAMAPPPSPSEWFAPRQGEPHGFVFYVHGGSFICERSPRLTAMVAQFAAAANARVFAPSYRLAPEHPCPAAVDDIVAAFRWFRETWPDEPAVALGDSAGAAILLAALQRLRDDGDTLPDGVVLLSPWADLSLQSWSIVAAAFAGTTGSTMEALGLMAHLYLQGRSAADPVASPMFGDFTGLPPMLIHASKGDILFDDATRLAERMRDAGGDLTVRLWAAETHVWEQHNSARARESIRIAADFIRRCLD